MQWEELTAPEFERAVKDVGGVCLLAAGCLERHGDHLPLGTDMLNGHAICRLAAEKEPAIVFPPYYFGQIHEARAFPGTIAIDPLLTVQLLMNVCDEIARNGLRKIIIYNAHGGNTHLVNYVSQVMLAERKDYAIYLPERLQGEERSRQWRELLDTDYGGHAGEVETSVSLANHERLVKMEAVGEKKGKPLGRLCHLPPGKATIWWYADYPDHYAGDASAASREKGLKLRQLIVDSLAEAIRAFKDDKVTLELMKDFYDLADRVGK